MLIAATLYQGNSCEYAVTAVLWQESFPLVMNRSIEGIFIEIHCFLLLEISRSFHYFSLCTFQPNFRLQLKSVIHKLPLFLSYWLKGATKIEQ